MTRRGWLSLGVGVAGLVLGAPLAYLLAWPVPIDPQPWDAPDPAARTWTPTGTLAAAERWELVDGHGPEDVDVDSRGRVYAGLQDGRIMRWTSRDAPPELLVDTGGRPLGLHWDAAGRLLVGDAWKGLLRVDVETGAVETLATECGGEPLIFTDDVETGPDGRIWFTDATTRFRQTEYKLDLLENGAFGRLCVYDPTDGIVREVKDGLYFANGVAVDPGGQFVLVNETSRYRVRKVWIDGPRKGTHEVILDNLPGFPDGISTGTNGTYWIALASPRNPFVDAGARRPWIRKLIVRLPAAVQPAPERTARLLGIDADGTVLHDLSDPEGRAFHVVSSVQERDGWLWLGSLADTAVARVRRP